MFVHTPEAWLLLTHKTGDNRQLSKVADIAATRLGWRIKPKQVRFLSPWDQDQVKPLVEPTLRYLDGEASDTLEPPWPDAVIMGGRRSEAVGLWIRRQNPGTRLILMGKPSGDYISCTGYDLIITNTGYFVPFSKNVLKIEFPLMEVDFETMQAAQAYWQGRFSGLARPLLGLMVGGEIKPYKFRQETVDKLLALADQVQAAGGTTVASVSRRTPAIVRASLEASSKIADLVVPEALDAPNPHFALMAEADVLAVTEDSASMMVEVARIKKPLWIVNMPIREKYGYRIKKHLKRHLARKLSNYPRCAYLLSYFGLPVSTRDLGLLQDHLRKAGAVLDSFDISRLADFSGSDLRQDACHAQIEKRLATLW